MTNEEAIALLKKATLFEPKLENKDYPEAFELAIKALETRSKGKWNEWEDERWGGVWYYCTNCHYDALYKRVDGILTQVLSDFCPNCGADMRGES